ncbi:MAG: hypothetical protein ACFB03_10795 [Paracoccaceae bacterium]
MTMITTISLKNEAIADDKDAIEDIKDAAKAADSAEEAAEAAAAAKGSDTSDLTDHTSDHGLPGGGTDAKDKIDGFGVDVDALGKTDVAEVVENRHGQSMIDGMAKGLDAVGGTSPSSGKAAEGWTKVGVGMTLVETGATIAVAGGTVMAAGAGATGTVAGAPVGVPTLVSGGVIAGVGVALGAIGGSLVVQGAEDIADAGEATETKDAALEKVGEDGEAGADADANQTTESGETEGGQSNEDGSTSGGQSKPAGDEGSNGDTDQDGNDEDDDTTEDSDEDDDTTNDSDGDTVGGQSNENGTTTGGQSKPVDDAGTSTDEVTDVDPNAERGGVASEESLAKTIALWVADPTGGAGLWEKEHIVIEYDESDVTGRNDPYMLFDPEADARKAVDIEEIEDRLDPVTLPVDADGGADMGAESFIF